MNGYNYNNESNLSEVPPVVNQNKYIEGGYVSNQYPEVQQDQQAIMIPIGHSGQAQEAIDISNDKPKEGNKDLTQVQGQGQSQGQPQSVPQESKTTFKDLPDLEKSIRLGFIRKVYGIFLTQLILTFGIVCITFIKVVSDFLKTHLYIFYIVVAATFVLFLVLICGKKIAKKVPINYILLFTWTLLESYMLATAASYYDYETVLSAIGITVGLAIGLTIFACVIKVDFTWCGGVLFALVAILVFGGIFGLSFGKWATIGYCALGVFVYSFYLIYDTQLILGSFRNKYSIDDYVFAAISLYVDMVNLFIYILSLLGLSN